MKKSVLSALMVCSITLTSVALPSAAFADEYDTKIQQQDQKINALTSQMSDAEAKVAAIENDMVETAKQIDTLTAKKNKLSSEVSKLYSEISDLNVRIQKREVQMTKQARDVQVNGQSDSIIDAVLDADSVADAIGRVQAVSTMMSANNELLEQQKEDKATVEKKTKNVEKQIAELEAATKELNDKTESLKTLKIQQEVAKNDLEAQRSEEQGKKDGFIKQKKEAEKRLAEEQARQRAAAKKAEEAKQAAALKEAQEKAAVTEDVQTSTTKTESSSDTSVVETATAGSSSSSSSSSNSSNSSNSSSSNTNNSNNSTVNTGGSGKDHSSSGNMYAVGQCTWYVKNRAPWVGTYWGNGAQWGASAAADGYTVNGTPAAGAVVVFAAGQSVGGEWTADGTYGHVAYVESYDPASNTITISQGGMGFPSPTGPNTATMNASGYTYIHR